MQFTIYPILDTMIGFYQKPRGFDRFKDYLSILHGKSKTDMEVPIPYFNPMGKPHILTQLMIFRDMEIEEVMYKAIVEVTSDLPASINQTISVVFALADDLKGGWTNHYSTDFDSKFKLNAYVTRNFCIPVFWTSETYDIKTIQRVTQEYYLRTIYWKMNSKPLSLEDHIKQEIFVSRHCTIEYQSLSSIDYKSLDHYYNTHKTSTDHRRIFNFMYGDEACRALGYKTFGIVPSSAGYFYAAVKCGQNWMLQS